MKSSINSLSWTDEKVQHEKNIKLIAKSELKLSELGYTLVTRNTYWLVYEESGKRHVFEDPESLYKFCYRKKYKKMKEIKKPVFVIQKSS